ncbi:MAG: tetratricopeptide repeat protein [Pyrinomonadaceae bacterium]
MNRQRFFFSFLGLLVGSAIGFAVANSVARTALKPPQSFADARIRAAAPVASGGEPQSSNDDDPALTLSSDELRNAINRGDANPSDRALQLNLGRALYLYAGHARDAALLPAALRFIKRAVDAQPRDPEANALLGNILFDLAQTSDLKYLAEARQAYLEALQAWPSDPDVLTGLGRTYHFDKPPNARSAIAAYEKALKADARHEAAMQNLINALLDERRHQEAKRRLEDLRQINPANAGLSNLQARLAQAGGAQQDRR